MIFTLKCILIIIFNNQYADTEETEAQEAAIRKRRGERSQTGGDVVMEGASDGGRTEEDYDGLVS